MTKILTRTASLSFLALMISLFICTDVVFSQQDGEKSLSEQYVEAVKKKDDDKRKELVEQLKDSRKERRNLRKNYPQYHRLYEMDDLSVRINDLKSQYRERFGSDAGTLVGEGRAGGTTDRVRPGGTPNQFRTKNSVAVQNSRNQDRSPNKVTSKSSNQRRRSIQDSIRNRSRR